MGVVIKARKRSTKGTVPGAGINVRILGLEITQSIQNLTHDVPLIRGKATVVRVYVKRTGFPPTGKLQGELAVSAVSGGPAKYVASSNVIAAGTNPSLAEQRNDIAASLNFILPAEATSWTGLSVRVNRIMSPDGDFPVTGTISVDATLVDAPPLRIKAVGLRYVWIKPDGGSVDVTPEAFHFDYLRSFLTRAFPVAEVIWSQIVVQANSLFTPPFAGPATPDGDDPLWRGKLDLAHNQLEAMRAKDIDGGMDPRTHYYGLVSDASAGLFFRGAAKDVPTSPDPSIVAVGPTGNPAQYSSLRWDKDRSYGDWYGTHELSHTFGRFHPGFCGQGVNDSSFPYADGRIGDKTHGDMVGLDIGDASLQLPMAALDNSKYHDIMTYCDDQWLSAYSYQGILARLRDEDVQFAPIA